MSSCAACCTSDRPQAPPSSEGALAEDGPSKHDVLAVVLPEGKWAFTLASHEDHAVAKAQELLRERQEDGSSVPSAPWVMLFESSEDLYESLELGREPISGAWVLVRYQRCGTFIPGRDTGCRGDDNGGYRTVSYDRHVCEAGSKYDECWNNFTVVGRFMTYPSRAACDAGDIPTTNDPRYGKSCD